MCKQVIIKFKKIDEYAHVPTYAHKGDSGMDLYSTVHRVINPGAHTLISTGLTIALPKGYEAQIRPRSGLANKHKVTVLNAPGTIDEGYLGIIQVMLINHGAGQYTVNVGDRIAQMVIAPVTKATCVEVKNLDETERGAGGFGSTGK